MPTPAILGGPINPRLVNPHLSGQSAVIDTENALRTFGGGPAPVFSRGSVAYRADGSQVATGVPRLERGRWHNALSAVTCSFSDANADGVADAWNKWHSSTAELDSQILYAITNGPRVGQKAQRIWCSSLTNLTAQRSMTITPSTKVPVTPGQVVSLVVWARLTSNPSGGAQVGVLAANFNSLLSYISTAKELTSMSVGTDWQRIVLDNVTVSSGVAYMVPLISCSRLDNGDSFDVEFADPMFCFSATAPSISLPGGYGERGAVMVEEGTVNLAVNGNFSNGLTGYSDWSAGNRTVSEVVSDPQAFGGKSYHVAVTAANGGITQQMTIIGGQIYTVSQFCRVVSGSPKALQIVTNGTPGLTPAAVVTTSAARTRYSYTFTAPADATLVSAYLGGSTSGTSEAYYDGLQVENKSYATSPGVGTRAAESLTLDVRGLLRAEEGAIGVWVYVTDTVKRNDGILNRIWQTQNAAGVSAVALRVNTPAFEAIFQRADGSLAIATTSPSTITNGWRYLLVRWRRGQAIELLSDGVVVARQSTNLNSLNSPDKLFLGSYDGASRFANTLFQQLRLFTRWPSDAEVRDLVNLAPLLGVA